MKTGSAARIHKYGGPEVVRVEKTSLHAPRAGELLVRIHAAGVNSTDWRIRAGYFQLLKAPPLPFTLGGDFSGVVDAAGPGCGAFKVGAAVYGQASVFAGGSGAFAEYAIARAATVALKPRSMSHTEASTLPTAGISALECLTKYLRLSVGQKILINGGGNSIGSIAIQLAKHLGVHVVTTVSAEHIEYVKSLGVDQVIEYESRQFQDIVGGLDGGLDAVGCDMRVQPFRVLKRGVHLTSVLGKSQGRLMNDVWLEPSALARYVTTAHLAELAQLVDNAELKVHVEKTVALEQVGVALQQVFELQRGSIVVKIG
jgi:NADPH:quinone reductase-like Zn-dependent oxidoreductase